MKNRGNVVVDNPNDEETRMNVKVISQVNAGGESSVNWRKVIIGGVAGVALGAAASYAVAQNVDVDDLLENSDDPDTQEPQDEPQETQDEPQEPQDEPQETQDEPQVEPQDYDDMSFGEAFAAARAELGPGEVFEWRGAEFSTYTKEEWDEVYPPQEDEPEPLELPDEGEFNVDDVIVNVEDPVVIEEPVNVYNGPVTIIQAGGDVTIIEGGVDIEQEIEVDQSVSNNEVNVIEDGKGDVKISLADVEQEQEIDVDNEVPEQETDDPVIPEEPGDGQILGDDAVVDDDASFDNDDVDFMV